jgi:hypothetical protein
LALPFFNYLLEVDVAGHVLLHLLLHVADDYLLADHVAGERGKLGMQSRDGLLLLLKLVVE